MDCTNTSRLPSFACLTMKPRSVIRIRRVSSIAGCPELVLRCHRCRRRIVSASSGAGTCCSAGTTDADPQQEQAAVRLRLALQILAEIDAVVGRLAGLLAAVIADFDEALHHLVRQVGVDVGLAEVPHLRRDVLQLVGQHAADLDLDVIDVARQVADFLVAGERQQRALARGRSAPGGKVRPEVWRRKACPKYSRRCPRTPRARHDKGSGPPARGT